MITYRVDVPDPRTHLFHVTLEVPTPSVEQRLSLPVWIPGSYLVREFGRHLSQLRARQGEHRLPLDQLDKTTWIVRCEPAAGALVVEYLVYAFDTSVRTAYLDTQRGFFNGTSICLRVEGREGEPHRLCIGSCPEGWDIATAMPATSPRVHEATDYDELVDHPFELGSFWRGRFEADGVPHEFVVAGALPSFDGERLLADARRICEAQIAFWHGDGPAQGGRKPPFERYVFMLNVVEEGYGGLEHRASTALIANRRDLPKRGAEGMSDGYATLLGLISHEYFHTWNVKRLKPRDFERLDYGRENYTRLLWFFEGFTSYYDDLLLVRSGLIDEGRYLKLIAKTINGVLGTPGRQVQTVAEASFDAWVKYYRSDENTPNATVSYYAKGSLVALALDLKLREEGAATLDQLMQRLWTSSGGGPISEDDIARVLEELAGRSIANDLQTWVHGTGELPISSLMQHMGIDWREEAATGLAQMLGLRVSEGPLTGVQVKAVLRGSAAERAGLAAGDELWAIDGWRVRRLDDALQWLEPGRPFEFLGVRDQRVFSLQVMPPDAAESPRTVTLAVADKATKSTAALRRAWLHG
ncbi:MAG TPA: PDZ domain-containing protein [Burkholderiaceae bacterium]|nr:PDZ domain-containing protein [Burkholderiaceae bacterium]